MINLEFSKILFLVLMSYEYISSSEKLVILGVTCLLVLYIAFLQISVMNKFF